MRNAWNARSAEAVILRWVALLVWRALCVRGKSFMSASGSVVGVAADLAVTGILR